MTTSSHEAKNLDTSQDQQKTNGGSKENTNKPGESVKFGEKPWVVLLQIMVIPFVTLGFTANQTQIEHNRQDTDSADKAIEIRQQVLTDYSKAISELVTKHKLGTNTNSYVQNIARGQTLIALRRLNVFDANDKNDPSKADNSKDNKAKADAGKLKGALIRYLYDLHLIGNYRFEKGSYVYEKPQIVLEGTDIDNAVLEDAWLANIDLTNSWVRNGNFKQAVLYGATFSKATLTNADFAKANLQFARLANADLTKAIFTDANLRGADLRGANLTAAKLSNANLDRACYIKGQEANYTRLGIEPNKFNMVAIDPDKSDPSKPNFEDCPTF